MPNFTEGFLRFDFDEHCWCVLKLDDHDDYRDRIQKIKDTKAIDFLGIFNNKTLYFIEVKDFRQHRIENKERLLSSDLAIELAQKVRDSVACIIGAYQTSKNPEQWQPFVEKLSTKAEPIVVLWLEQDLPSHPIQKKKVTDSIDTKYFKQKLFWLTKRVIVCSIKDDDIVPKLYVSNLPHN